MDQGFGGRLAVVTGADSGIGLHTAMTLAAEGAKVLMTNMNEAPLADASGLVRRQHPMPRCARLLPT